MAKFGLSTLEGIQGKEREHPLLSLSLSELFLKLWRWRALEGKTLSKFENDIPH
jgi:hypothetical protein